MVTVSLASPLLLLLLLLLPLALALLALVLRRPCRCRVFSYLKDAVSGVVRSIHVVSNPTTQHFMALAWRLGKKAKYGKASCSCAGSGGSAASPQANTSRRTCHIGGGEGAEQRMMDGWGA